MKCVAPEFKPFLIIGFRILIIFSALINGLLYIPTLGWSIHWHLKLCDKFAAINIDKYGYPHRFSGELYRIDTNTKNVE